MTEVFWNITVPLLILSFSVVEVTSKYAIVNIQTSSFGYRIYWFGSTSLCNVK